MLRTKKNIEAMQATANENGVEQALCLLLWLGVSPTSPSTPNRSNQGFILKNSDIDTFVSNPMQIMTKMIIFPGEDVYGIQSMVRQTEALSESMHHLLTAPFLPSMPRTIPPPKVEEIVKWSQERK